MPLRIGPPHPANTNRGGKLYFSTLHLLVIQWLDQRTYFFEIAILIA